MRNAKAPLDLPPPAATPPDPRDLSASWVRWYWARHLSERFAALGLYALAEAPAGAFWLPQGTQETGHHRWAWEVDIHSTACRVGDPRTDGATWLYYAPHEWE